MWFFFSAIQTSCRILIYVGYDNKRTHTLPYKHTSTPAEPYSTSTLTPWKGLLIDQSALTAVWRELLTLWLQRFCVQWPCKGSLTPTLGVSIPCPGGGDVHAHTRPHTHTSQYIYVYDRLFRANPPPPNRYAQPQSGKCTRPVWKWRHRKGSSSRDSVLILSARVLTSLQPQGEQVQQVQQAHTWHSDQPLCFVTWSRHLTRRSILLSNSHRTMIIKGHRKCSIDLFLLGYTVWVSLSVC